MVVRRADRVGVKYYRRVGSREGLDDDGGAFGHTIRWTDRFPHLARHDATGAMVVIRLFHAGADGDSNYFSPAS